MKKVNQRKLLISVLSIITGFAFLLCAGTLNAQKKAYATTENWYGFETEYATADWVGVVSRLPVSQGATSVTFKYKITEQSSTLSTFFGIARGTFTRNANNGAADIDYFRMNSPANFTIVGAEYTITVDLSNFANSTIVGTNNGSAISGLTLPALTKGANVTNDHIGLLLLGENYNAKYQISCYDNLGKDLQITTLSLSETKITNLLSAPTDVKVISNGGVEDTLFARTKTVSFANGNRANHSLTNAEISYIKNDNDLISQGSTDGDAVYINLAGVATYNNWLLYSMQFGGSIKVSEMAENEKLVISAMANFLSEKTVYLYPNSNEVRAETDGIKLSISATNNFKEYFLSKQQCELLKNENGYIDGFTLIIVGDPQTSTNSSLYIDGVYLYEEYVNANPINYTFTTDYKDDAWVGVISRLPVSKTAKRVYFNYKIIEQNQAPTVLAYASGTFTKTGNNGTINTNYLRASAPANLYLVKAEYTVVFNLNSFASTTVFGKTENGENISIPALSYNAGSNVSNDHFGLFLVGNGYKSKYQISCYDDTGKDLQITTLSASNSSVSNILTAPQDAEMISSGTVNDALFVGTNTVTFAKGERTQHSFVNSEISYLENDADLIAKGSSDGNGIEINLSGENNAQTWIMYSIKFGGRIKASDLSNGSKLIFKMFSTATRENNTPIYLYSLDDNVRPIDENTVSIPVVSSRVFSEYELTKNQIASLVDSDGYFSGITILVVGAMPTQDAKIYIDEVYIKNGDQSIKDEEYNDYFKAYYNSSTKTIYSIVDGGQENVAVLKIIKGKSNIQTYPCTITNAGQLVYSGGNHDINTTVMTIDGVQCWTLKESYSVTIRYADGKVDTISVGYEDNYLLPELKQSQIENNEFDSWKYGNGEEVDFNGLITSALTIYEKQKPVIVKTDGGCNSSVSGNIIPFIFLFSLAMIIIKKRSKKVGK